MSPLAVTWRNWPGRAVALLLFLLLGLAPACGYIRPVPEGFSPQDYTPITFEQLRAPRQGGLQPGQKVRVDGYFWEFLKYDPAMVRSYLTLARQPLAGRRLRWASLYGAPQMQGYFDRLALTREQEREWRLRRLEHVRLFGELAPLGLGTLYLQAHHVDRLEGEGEPPPPGDAGPPPAPEGSFNP